MEKIAEKVEAAASMGHELEICSRCGLAHVRLEGVVTGPGLYEVLSGFAADGTWSLAKNDVWDLRATRDFFIKPREADWLAARLPQVDEAEVQGRTALLTRTVTQQAYGIVLFQTIRPFSRVRRTFRSERRAVRWLAERSSGTSGDGSAEAASCGSSCPSQACRESMG